MPSSVSDSDNSGNGDNCESSGVPTDGDTATSSNEESSSSAGEGDDPFQQQVAARFQELRLKSARHCRAEAPKLIADNHDKIKQWLDRMRVQERQQGSQPALPALPKASASLLCGSDDGGSSSDSDAGPKDRGMQPAGPQTDFAARRALTFVPRRPRRSGGAAAERVHTNNTSAADRMPVMCAATGVIPSFRPPSQFVAWQYLKRNELARNQGKRLFYTDDTGETVPASDDEEENSLPWKGEHGVALDHALHGVVQEFGKGEEVSQAIATKLGVPHNAVSMRLDELTTVPITDEQRGAHDVNEVCEAFNEAFCRRCRIYCCRLHGGGHVLPDHRMAPLSFATAASKQPPPPCGPSCWQLATGMCSSNSGGDAATSGTRGAWAWQDRGGEGRRTLGDLIKRFRAIEVEGLGGVGQGQGQQVQQQQQQWPRRQSQGDGPHMVEDEGSQPVLQPQPLTPPLLLLPQQRQGLGGELQGVQGAEPEGMHIDAQTEEGPSQGSGACNSQGNAQGTGVAAHTETARGVPKWSDQELALLEKGRAMFGTYHPCGIALLLRPDSGSGGSGKAGGGQLTPQTTGRSCVDVARWLWGLQQRENGGHAEGGPRGGTARGSVGGDAPRNRRTFKKARRMSFMMPTGAARKNTTVIRKRLAHQMDEAWTEFQACTCCRDGSGVCTSNCSCVKNKNFCEKYCGCGPKCTNRFKGCRCTGQCRNRSCPCLAAGRECDPDLCRNCNAMCEGCAPPESECHNMRLRLRQHKRVVMGQSIVAGWGAFLHDGAKKGDFIGEYTGDLITQDEADRRGRIYDKINNSYLFNLNQEWVLDARHRGNKLRFANHSSDPNCKARILMVDGDHRVAIFAAKHIAPGDELFYDYRYQQEQAPVWAQGRD